MNTYQQELLRVIRDQHEMDGERVMTISWEDLINLTFKADPDVEFAFAWRAINWN